MDYFLNTIIIPLLITIAGIVIVLLIDRMRLPNLEIAAREDANSDNTYREPHPVTTPCDKEELLDVIAKYEADKETYAWNNEAYFENWRPSKYKLNKGIYEVNINIDTQNGKSFRQKFTLKVEYSIEDSSLSNGS